MHNKITFGTSYFCAWWPRNPQIHFCACERSIPYNTCYHLHNLHTLFLHHHYRYLKDRLKSLLFKVFYFYLQHQSSISSCKSSFCSGFGTGPLGLSPLLLLYSNPEKLGASFLKALYLSSISLSRD